MPSRSWFRVLKKYVAAGYFCLLKPRDIHSGPTSLGGLSEVFMPDAIFCRHCGYKREVWFMAGKFSWTLGVLIAVRLVRLIRFLLCLPGNWHVEHCNNWDVGCCTWILRFPHVTNVEVEVQSVHSVNYNSVFSGSCGGRQPTTLHQLTQYDDISVDDFTSILKKCLVLLAAVILGFTHFLLSLFECHFFWFLQALSAQAMVQGLLALPRKSDTQTRAAQLFTVFSQADIYCIPNILSQLTCIISNTFSDMMYLNKGNIFWFLVHLLYPTVFHWDFTSWIEAAFDGEVPQPLYGVGISGLEARGTSPAATPVNASGVCCFFLGRKNFEEKNEFVFFGRSFENDDFLWLIWTCVL